MVHVHAAGHYLFVKARFASFASFCMGLFLTTPLVLYFPYSTCSCIHGISVGASNTIAAFGFIKDKQRERNDQAEKEILSLTHKNPLTKIEKKAAEDVVPNNIRQNTK